MFLRKCIAGFFQRSGNLFHFTGCHYPVAATMIKVSCKKFNVYELFFCISPDKLTKIDWKLNIFEQL